MGKVKTGIGLLEPKWHAWDGTKYASGIELGSAVKAYLSIETDEFALYGDDVDELDYQGFKRGTLTTETWFDDLEAECAVFGATFTAGTSPNPGSATDGVNDAPPLGGVSYIRHLLVKNPSTGAQEHVYRAVVLPMCTAKQSSLKEEADTKGDSLSPKTHPVDFVFKGNAAGAWRKRQDCATLTDARSFITTNLPTT